MSVTYECKCCLTLDGRDLQGLHFAISEFSRLTRDRQGVLAAFFNRRGQSEEVELLLHAVDEHEARALAATILAEIERAANDRFGAGSVHPGALEVQPAAEIPSKLMQELSDLFAPSFVEQVFGLADERDLQGPEVGLGEAGTKGSDRCRRTEDIVSRLRAWKDLAEFEVLDVGPSHVTLKFARLPDDIPAFAAEAHELCPDLESDPEGLEELHDEYEPQPAVRSIAEQLRRESKLRLWWA